MIGTVADMLKIPHLFAKNCDERAGRRVRRVVTDSREAKKGDVFVAYHGSWNRSEKGGYAVTRILFDNGRPYGELKYLNFLGADGKVLGRPVDVEQDLDGSLLISDDYGNKIYRLSYTGS